MHAPITADTGAPRRIASIWLPNFATDRLARDGEAPIATTSAAHGGLRVSSASAKAQRAGVLPGLPLADALALAPGLRTVPGDHSAERRDLDALADWCGRYTPLTAADGNDGLWLDVTGCAWRFGGEATLLDGLVARLWRMGFTARGAIADTPGAAWALARHGDPNPGRVAPPGASASCLVDLPTVALRLSPATVEGLRRIGLGRVGDLVEIPRAPLAASFGEETARRLDQALGLLDETVRPRRPAPLFHARSALQRPSSSVGDAAKTARGLLDDVCAAMERARRGARMVSLAVYRPDGATVRAKAGTARPTRDPAWLEHLLLPELEALDIAPGFDALSLEVIAHDPLAAKTTPAPQRLPADRLRRLPLPAPGLANPPLAWPFPNASMAMIPEIQGA